ncbi:MAG: type IX secretion system membrane protein PorP/SprF [Flavobacteriales bacterium]|nr:type IX secretion system membrane protein PorP/SprF [Flavobacteriales bacterium]
MKKSLITTVLILATGYLCAQQELLVSQYMFNGLFINPAYSGSHPYAEATGLYRAQWVGLDGAPTTQTFGIDGSIADETMGIGLTFVNDQIGDTRQTEVFANWSYHLWLDADGKNRLSFGIRAGFSDYSSRLNETSVVDSGDPIFENNVSNAFVPKFGAGIYYYTKLWYAGVSIPTLFAADDDVRFNINDVGDRYFDPHTYITAGYVWNVNTDLAVKPSFLVRYLNGSPLQADINCNLLIKNTFWIGASYRTGDAVIGILEYNIGNDLRIGYAYDFTTTAIGDYSSGSHELMLSYKFGRDPVKTKSPRYF